LKSLFKPTQVMKRDSRILNNGYWILTILLALALFVAAAGAGPEDYVPAQPLEDWLNVAANIVCVIFGALVLIPRTRIIGAIFAVIYMFGAMYVNYTVAGIDFFVSAIPYNTVSLAIASLLVGHYIEDLHHVFNRSRQGAETLSSNAEATY